MEEGGAGSRGTGEEVLVVAEAGRGGVELLLEEVAGSGGKPALEAGRGEKAMAAGREEITTHWNQHPAQMPTATW